MTLFDKQYKYLLSRTWKEDFNKWEIVEVEFISNNINPNYPQDRDRDFCKIKVNGNIYQCWKYLLFDTLKEAQLAKINYTNRS